MRVNPPSVPRGMYWPLVQHSTDRALCRVLRDMGVRVKRLGSGCFRTAYLVNYGERQFVVKHKGELGEGVGPTTRSKRIRHAPTRKIGVWHIQHYYTPCPTMLRKWLAGLGGMCGDYKPQNVGVDTDGTLVAFDW